MHLLLLGIAIGVVIGHVGTAHWPTISAWLSSQSEPR
jgi:hypothetical protein